MPGILFPETPLRRQRKGSTVLLAPSMDRKHLCVGREKSTNPSQVIRSSETPLRRQRKEKRSSYRSS